MSRARHLLWVGLVLVFSAALAREYDAEFIPRRPWIILVPLGASLVSSFLLFCCLWGAAARRDGNRLPFWRNYLPFLGLFWMTAPLAWLYAIPFERFLSPVDAIQANYALLGLVASWRVLLMIRVAQVWFGRSAFGSAALVLVYGDAVLVAALILSPWPVIAFMAGNSNPVALAEHNIRFLVLLFGILGLPVLGVCALLRIMASRINPAPEWLKHPKPPLPLRVTWWIVAALSIVAWVPILPFTQAEVRDRPNPEEQREQDWEDLRRQREELIRPHSNE
ncbi:MAG: hypothetical protein KJ044_03485 [Planctomycetes bacterium]|nr:hypothetical protein [Planctomycetota bacterium]